MEQRVLRTGTVVVVCALLLRLASGMVETLDFTQVSRLASFMIFMQTGRVVRPNSATLATEPTEVIPETEPENLPQTIPIEPDRPVFSPEEAKTITLSSGFSYSVDLPELLTRPLNWDLMEGEPKVLIVHSHGSESFAPTGEYEESSPYHTLDAEYNMVSVGAYVAELLQEAGISVLHDRTLHDEPSYNASYNNSRKSVQAYLQAYPSICLVLDLHRDSIEDASGNQVAQTVFSQGETYAPLMIVVGTDYGGLEHPNWQENLSLALKLQLQLEGICPGICRNINLRTQRFNQDLSLGAMLVEVGTSGNTRQEAFRAAEVLAKGIISLAYGSE